MDSITFAVQTRDPDTKAKTVRREGMIPGVYYGKGVDNKMFKVDYQAFRKLYLAAGKNTIIDLEFEDKTKVKALVHEVGYDPVTDKVTHVDFINIRMDEKITTQIPIILTGTAPAVKDLAGTLTPQLTQLTIRCLPGDLIHKVEVGVEPLVDFHSVLHVSDVVVPPEIEIVDPPELTIANVAAPRTDKDEEETDETTEAEGEETAEEEKKSEEKAE